MRAAVFTVARRLGGRTLAILAARLGAGVAFTTLRTASARWRATGSAAASGWGRALAILSFPLYAVYLPILLLFRAGDPSPLSAAVLTAIAVSNTVRGIATARPSRRTANRASPASVGHAAEAAA